MLFNHKKIRARLPIKLSEKFGWWYPERISSVRKLNLGFYSAPDYGAKTKSGKAVRAQEGSDYAKSRVWFIAGFPRH